jgi:hypothetical protein
MLAIQSGRIGSVAKPPCCMSLRGLLDHRPQWMGTVVLFNGAMLTKSSRSPVVVAASQDNSVRSWVPLVFISLTLLCRSFIHRLGETVR